MLHKALFSVLAGILTSLPVWAQSQGAVYQYFPDVKVTAYGRQQSMPFCGGVNNPQFTMGDLNNDGLQDLVIFENMLSLRTFLNTGVAGAPKYVYAPQYELNFPAASNYMILADYNCDTVPDLFTQQSQNGFSVWTGYYNTANQLCFKYYKYLSYYNNNPAGSNATVNLNTDVPAIVDNNGDGRLDFFAFSNSGGYVNYYKNVSAYMGHPCDSIDINLKDLCWGRFEQPVSRTHYLNYNCTQISNQYPDPQAFKVTHGGNSLCLFDYDGDGDYDYLNGNNMYAEMTFLLNGRVEKGSGADSMVYQDTMWQANGKKVFLPTQPAAYNVDIDQDGKKDLLISPHAAGASENYKCVWFYKNGTTPGHPSWTFMTDTMLVDQMIDVGTAAYPQFFDYDKDGKPDLFIGTDGYYQANGQLVGKIAYYRNTSTPGNVSFELVTKDFMGISAQNFQGVAPTFGDLNNDGKTDMILGHTDGTLSFYQNNAASNAVAPKWAQIPVTLNDSAGNVITAIDHAAPFIYDLNSDSRPDLIIGGSNGNLRYYENHSRAGATINLVLVSNKVGHVKADANYVNGAFSAPFVGKLDNTGRPYLLVGSNSGSLYRYDNFMKNGVVADSFRLLDRQYSWIDSAWSLYWNNRGTYNNLRSAPTVADIDGDGRYEMVVGGAEGGVKIYRQVLNVGITAPAVTQANPITVFPNPAKNIVTINWTQDFAEADLTITLYNSIGQKVAEKTAPNTLQSTQLSIPGIPNGIYFCVVTSGTKRNTVQVTVLK